VLFLPESCAFIAQDSVDGFTRQGEAVGLCWFQLTFKPLRISSSVTFSYQPRRGRDEPALGRSDCHFRARRKAERMTPPQALQSALMMEANVFNYTAR